MKFLLLASAAVLFSSCASILSHNKYPVTINTHPNAAWVSVKKVNGQEIFSGESPATLVLKSGDGYFKKAYYTVTISKEGYEDRTVPIRFGFNEWYFGNVIFGGAIGMLIIDPWTGAMYKLKDEYIHVNLQKAAGHAGAPQLKIYDLHEIPEAWRAALVEVKP